MSDYKSGGNVTSPNNKINESNEELIVYNNSESAKGTSTETSTEPNCGYDCPRQLVKVCYECLSHAERDAIKVEYYKSYDLMTGLRTAASLGGTILLFSLFILYKMKCRHRHGKRPTLVQTSIGRGSDTDIEKAGGLFPNGNPALINDKMPNMIAINNVGGSSRRSSRVVLCPEDFQILSRNDSRLSSLTATCSRHDGSRMSCGTILPFQSFMSVGETLPSSLSVATESQLAVPPLTPLSRTPTPRFLKNDECGSTFNLLRPDLAGCAEPIDIHIIQPTPNVSPCGSIRRLSEDASALMNHRHRDGPSVLIPLLTLPKPHLSKIKCKSKKLHRQNVVPADLSPDSDCDGDLTCPALKASTSSASRRSDSGNVCQPSSNAYDCTLNIKFIDCSDSDAVSLSSDSEAFGGVDSDVGSPSSPTAGSCNFVHDFLPALQTNEHAHVDWQLNANQTNEDLNVSETMC